jgi:dihydrofolate reductase
LPSEDKAKRIVMVAAVADNGVIGLDGGVPWHLPEDLAHVRRVTTGHTMVMGRRTFEQIGHPLPFRTNVVLTRQPYWSFPATFAARDVEDALSLAERFDGDIVIFGGGEVFESAFPFATHQILTEVHQSPEGDTYYPEWDRSEWKETRREPHDGYDFVWWERQTGS